MTVEDDGRCCLESLPLKDYRSIYLARTIHFSKYKVLKTNQPMYLLYYMRPKNNRLLSAHKQKTYAKHRESNYIPPVRFDS